MDLNIKEKNPKTTKPRAKHVLFAFKPFILHTKVAL